MRNYHYGIESMPAIIRDLAGTDTTAMALVCMVGEGESATVSAFITPGAGAQSLLFCHAIEMEKSYSDTLLNFDQAVPPFYGEVISLDLCCVAKIIGVEKILCLVTLDCHGGVAAIRDYDGVEVTVLEAAQTQLERFKEILESVSVATPGRFNNTGAGNGLLRH